MRLDARSWRPWVIPGAVLLFIGLLWWQTAGSDAEWALWRRYSAAAATLNVACSALLLAAGYVLVSPQNLRVRLMKTALAGGSLLFVLGALEMPAVLGYDYGHLLGTRENDTWLQLAMGVNRRDDELIHLHQPHTRYRGKVTGNLVRLGIPVAAMYDVDVAYDQHGFRNEEDLNRVDVVAIGDSFVEAAETPRPQTVAAEIGRRLGASVANLGQSSYGPQQELVVLRRYGLPLSPKVVVWFFFGGNDLADVDAYEWRRSHLDEFLAPPPFGSRSFLRNSLHAIAKLTTVPRRAPSPQAWRHAATFVRADGVREVQYLDAPEGDIDQRQWQVAAETIARADEATRRAGAAFLLVYIPRKLRVYRGFLQAAPDAYAHTWPMNDFPDLVADWCNERGIAWLDATVPLRAAVASGESVHLTDDVHWNAAGHRVVAEAVARRIEELGYLKPVSRSESR